MWQPKSPYNWLGLPCVPFNRLASWACKCMIFPCRVCVSCVPLVFQLAHCPWWFSFLNRADSFSSSQWHLPSLWDDLDIFFPSFLSLFHNSPWLGIWVGWPFLPGLMAEGKWKELGPCPAQMPLWFISPLKKKVGAMKGSLLAAETLALIACPLKIKIYYNYIKKEKKYRCALLLLLLYY